MSDGLPKFSGLPPKRLKYLRLLAEGWPQGEAAVAVGVTDRTARLWEDDPEFQRELRKELDTRLARSRRHLEALTAKACRVFEEALSSLKGNEAEWRYRLAAAREILDRAGLEPPGGQEDLLIVWRRNRAAFDAPSDGAVLGEVKDE